MTALLDVPFVAAALAGRIRDHRGESECVFTRAIIDSREARPGDLFVALPGERVDGHDYAAAAVAAGASGCLLSRHVDLPGEAAVLVVDDTLGALQDLGAAWRARLGGLEVVGITGSVGKTTTKGVVASVLASRYRVQANPLNYNNEISVPLCLLELIPGTERAVIEMGMYTRGEIALLCEWARPATGLVLNVGPVHLERAGSIDAIALAKRELVEALPAGGHAILNADDPRVDAMAAHTEADIWRFGTVAHADVRGHDLESHGVDGFTFTLEYGGQSASVRVPLAGRHLLTNVLAGAAAGFANGLAFDEVTEALRELDIPLRLRVIERADGVRVLDDTYNAQPSSMRAALDLLQETPVADGARRIALLGDMLELGAVSRDEHVAIGERAATIVDRLFTIGTHATDLAEAARSHGHAAVEHVPDRDAAIERLRAELRPGDAVLIKASHALGLEDVVAALATPSDDTGAGPATGGGA